MAKDTRLIQDPAIEPYNIKADDSQYTVFKPLLIKSGKNKGNVLEQQARYFGSLEGALRFIARAKASKGEDVKSIREYLNDYKAIVDQIKMTIEIDN